jgi:hypothetical protein
MTETVVNIEPLPDPPAVNVLQGNGPCHPLAIHDRFPPIGIKPPPTKEPKP